MASQQEAPLDAVYFDNANDMDLVERYLADLQQQQQQQPVEVQPPAPSGKSFRIFQIILILKRIKLMDVGFRCRTKDQEEGNTWQDSRSTCSQEGQKATRAGSQTNS